ncbi:MAG: hypothetical protein KJ887_00590 [Candidatus Omnitrophica bacterium]|nr:hypothetical protein [Candidatus Omnitrophota bacterium]MBU1047114.1 hypothetical protein [Candidatus Omnitrophota bacterium]MBU1631460.1 hypothetical protein [Candidatus Omnitrophota bacterium]MBU1767693.1 hypothetical protein [Candidatus Omnitrophota bacterium]MBU1889608.1 hypothetical protein [Candidatus Omnitrophota bacterium]
MTISRKVKNNLIDAGIVISIAFISYLLLSIVSLLFLKLGLFHPIFVGSFLSAVFTGLLQGFVTANLIRNRNLFVAIIPAISLFVFAILYFSFSPYFSLSIFWREPYVIVSWLLLISSAFLSARWVLKRRTKDSTHKN